MTSIEKTLLTHWRGKTVYRKCECGETAFDATYVVEIPLAVIARYLYRCRNCNIIHRFRKAGQ